MRHKPTLVNLSEYGEILSTRERGREVADHVQDVLRATTGLVLNFTGVEVATPSFLDEILIRIRSVLQSEDDGVAVVVTGTNEDVLETLNLVLRHQRLMLAQLAQNQLELLGGNQQLRETLAAAQKLGTFTATQLADDLRLKLPNLHQRLKALMDAGAVTRQADETAQHGKRYLFEAIDADEIEAITSR
jgi:transcriptional regulator of heat shock response